MERDEIIKRVYDLSFEYERGYHGCVYSTIVAIQDALGINKTLKSCTMPLKH